MVGIRPTWDAYCRDSAGNDTEKDIKNFRQRWDEIAPNAQIFL